MATKIFTNLDLQKNSLVAPVIDPQATAPSSPILGQAYTDTVTNKIYFYNGSSWIDLTQQTATAGMAYAGAIDASTNPNYPAAAVGDVYIFSVAGKIGGASGEDVQAGDMIICNTVSAGGTEAAEGAKFDTIQANMTQATTTVPGYVELATQAEAKAKTDTERAVTPASLADFALKPHIGTITASSGATITAGTHGLGAGKKGVTLFSGDDVVTGDVSVAANGDVTWATSVAITGSIVITG